MSPITSLLERPPAPPAAPAPRAPRAGATLALQVPRTVGKTRAPVRQLVVGLVVLPLTVLPFVAYLNMTPEGRLVRDRALVALAPPRLPTLSPKQRAAAVAAAPRYDNAVMALAYHGIGSAGDGEGGFVISAKQFGEHLATLKAAGMRTVTAAQVAAAFTGGEPLPPNAVMISFDDGRSDAMMFADPLLDQADMSATMFLIADAASKPGVYYASWERV
jgi:Polysaccharide deacetylase